MLNLRNSLRMISITLKPHTCYLNIIAVKLPSIMCGVMFFILSTFWHFGCDCFTIFPKTALKSKSKFVSVCVRSRVRVRVRVRVYASEKSVQLKIKVKFYPKLGTSVIRDTKISGIVDEHVNHTALSVR